MMQQSQNGVREASARLHTSARPAAPSPNDRGRLADFAEELSAISDGLKCKAEALTVREAKLASREAKLASDTAGRQLFAAEESQQAVHTLHARWSHLVHRLQPVESHRLPCCRSMLWSWRRSWSGCAANWARLRRSSSEPAGRTSPLNGGTRVRAYTRAEGGAYGIVADNGEWWADWTARNPG
jgi:hypothetical protein